MTKGNLNQKVIKELCGTVSYKKGEAFYRKKKVTFIEETDDYCRATVHGTEDFHVEVKRDKAGTIIAQCSCPPILNYSKYCQHIAAVLIAIQERNKDGNELVRSNSEDVTANFIAIFQERNRRVTGRQYHFETRKMLDCSFTLTPFSLGNEQFLICVDIQVDSVKVDDIQAFLKDFNAGKESRLSLNFTYNPDLHYFPNDVDRVLKRLAQVVYDEAAFLDQFSNRSYNKGDLLIPPSAWPDLVKLFTQIPNVKVVHQGHAYSGFDIVQDSLPITFEFHKKDDKDFQLIITGFENMVVLPVYQSVLYNGKVYKLNRENSERLFELKQMVSSGMNTIFISKEQLDLFFKKIAPSLKKLGKVQMSKSFLEGIPKTPLVAKVYFDRIKNRLLAGLEFHYKHVVIQPLEDQTQFVAPHIYRDMEKEAEIFQIMEDSGFTRTDAGYYMRNEELEYNFLVHRLPHLQKLAQVYVTTAVRNRVVRSTQPKIRIKMNKERTNWLEFKFEMDGIPEKEVKEILAYLQLKRKYYRLPNGSLLSLETKEMEEVRRFLEEEPVQDDYYEATLNRPVLQSLKYLDKFLDSEIFKPEESFRRFIEQLVEPGSLDIPVPRSLEPILRDYQKAGYKWMKMLANYGFGGVLADEMGLGKTIQSIAFIVSELRSIREKNNPVLIVCPSSLTYNWFNELISFAPDVQARIIDGNRKERREKQKRLGGVDVLITSYPLLRQDISWYEKQYFHTIFFDEAQYFKNPITQTARAVKKLKASNRFALTGTPMENSSEELWSIFHVVFPELFKGLEEFNNLTRKQIAKRVRPFLLRRVKQDVLGELPEKDQALEFSDLFPEQKKLYAAFLAKLREETLKHLDKETFEQNKIRILAGLTRLRQICCHPALFVEGYKGSSAKYEQLFQILEEAKLSGRRVLIFSQFTKMLMLIGKELINREYPYFYLDGNTPSEERVELCSRFNNGECDVFLISLKAGGTGLNLTGADTVILYDLWWNPAVEEQAIDRAHRMGQTETVQVIKMIARGTIEEKMYDLQKKKKELIANIIEPSENITSTLTEEDIREILML